MRDEATRRGLAHSRGNLIRVGVEMRAAGGPGALARRILPLLARPSVVDSIRNPGEVAVLRRLPRFLLLGVDAPPALRFQRSLRRGRLGDGATLEEFVRMEARENSRRRAGQQLRATFRLADARVDNDGTIAELHKATRRTLGTLGLSLGRRARATRPRAPSRVAQKRA
ncbi:MAG: hypothetical protein ACRD6R_12590 [Candidatus Polarisedimenticolia bacterium]